jgi:hypothetical protein
MDSKDARSRSNRRTYANMVEKIESRWGRELKSARQSTHVSRREGEKPFITMLHNVTRPREDAMHEAVKRCRTGARTCRKSLDLHLRHGNAFRER